MKAGFLNTLDVRLLPESETVRWMLLSPLRYYSEVMKQEIAVPMNFVTDFVSFVLLKNLGHRASVIHDFLYSCVDVDRSTADKVLKEALLLTFVDRLVTEQMYLAVRAFGGGHKDNLYYLSGELVHC